MRSGRHLDFFEHQAFLHAQRPPDQLPQCSVRLVNVSWRRPGSGFKLLIEAFAMTLATSMPVAGAARLVRVDGTRLWCIVQRSRPFADASPTAPPDRIGQHEHI